jgi:hypothetical protein
MLGDRLGADRERFGQLVDGGLALRQPRQDLATGRVGERRECAAELVGSHCYSGVYLIKELIEYGTGTADGHRDRRSKWEGSS